MNLKKTIAPLALFAGSVLGLTGCQQGDEAMVHEHHDGTMTAVTFTGDQYHRVRDAFVVNVTDSMMLEKAGTDIHGVAFGNLSKHDQKITRMAMTEMRHNRLHRMDNGSGN